MFHPEPKIVEHPIIAGHSCLVIDDALIDPQQLRTMASAQREAFAGSPHNAYPGLQLMMPESVSQPLADFFTRHIRRRLGARRTVRMYSRLAMVNRPPEQLDPRQWICHRDLMYIEPGQCSPACVLYLFDNPALGGTHFFAPRQSPRLTAQLVHDSSKLPSEAFTRKYGIAQGYQTESNDYFEKVLSIPARFNRLIFYDGGVFHSGDTAHPPPGTDPAQGRLTLNGFFVCRSSL